MYRARTAKGNQRKAARIAALFRHMHARCRRHGLIHNAANAKRGIIGTHAQLGGKITTHGACDGVEVKRHFATEEIGRIKPAQHQIGIGHRRLNPAAPVADRPWLGARAPRANLHQPGSGINPRDGTTTGADFDHIHDGDFQRQARTLLKAPHAPRLEIEFAVRRAILDQAHLGGGAAHVIGNHLVQPGALREP